MAEDPHFPTTLADGHPLLIPTHTKTEAVVTPDSPIYQTWKLLEPGSYPRTALHQAILKHFLSTSEDSQPTPEAWITGGGSGAGKTAILRLLQDDGHYHPEGKVPINADDIKELLPEYFEIVKAKDSRAAEIVHEESSILARDLLAMAITLRQPIVYDGTLSNFEKSKALIDDLKAAGYKVCFVGVVIDPRIALERAMERASQTKRYVPVSSLVKAHANFNRYLPAYLEMMGEGDVAYVFDNSGNRVRPKEIFVDGALLEDYVSTIHEYSTFSEADLQGPSR